jgi:dCTP deaminase
MSALSKLDIRSRMQRQELVVSPLLSGTQIGDSSVDLRVGNVFLTVRARGISHVDPQVYNRNDDATHGHANELIRRQKHERHEVPFETTFLLHPGMLALVPTLEWVKLPADLQGVVTARSCWAREGLSIATATLINPHYHGIITLELANLGQIPISLYPGLRIAQVAFYQLETPLPAADKSRSQFAGTFEPMQGNIVEGDEAFMPPRSKRPTPAH